MNNILVLVNLSAGAERIAKLSLKIARQLNANLILCNAFELTTCKQLVYANNPAYTVDYLGENNYSTVDELADTLKTHYYYEHRNAEHQPKISCIDTALFTGESINELVMENKVSMIIAGTDNLLKLKTTGLLNIIDNSRCPVMVLPNDMGLNTFDSTAYVTDLRYCDIEVVSFLKRFNAKIFLTHVSSSGIPDMEDSYAQTLLNDAIANRIGYNKLFLRNIKGSNRKKDLELITTTAAIKFFTIVNNKHYVLERFLSDAADSERNYHKLPLLIMPYPNWTRF
jgi:nucleotide-binding universal stress UspA family protein